MPLSPTAKMTLESMSVKHFSVEGHLMFVALLFVPRHALVDLFETKKKRNHINVYVLVEDWSEFIPERLKFVEGVVVSDTVSLDVSQETRRQSKDRGAFQSGSSKPCMKKTFEQLAEGCGGVWE